MTGEAEQVVRAFCAAWERRDLETILDLMAEEVVYQNVPAPAMVGRKAARRFLAQFTRETTAVDFIVHAIATAADGRSVLTERLDRLHYPGGVVDLPIMGIFVVEDGRITEWRDYSNGASAAAQFQAAGVTLALDPE